MERSRERTPISKRSKGACSIALVVTLVCAIFGVGGAAAGDGKYARHVRQERLEARLAGAALAHRTPQQLLLAITPKTHSPAASAPATTPAATVNTPAATTTPATTTTTPATTTTATTPVSTPSTTTPADTSTTSNDGTTDNQPAGADNGTTTTPGTTTTGTTTTPGTTTPGNASGIDDGSGNTDTGNANTDTGTDNTDPASSHSPGAGGLGTTTPECHGRCSGLGQSETSGVVPTTLPSTVASSTSTGFNLGVSAIPSTSSTSSTSTSTAASSVPTDVSTGALNPTSGITSSPTPSSSSASSPATSSGGSSAAAQLSQLLSGSFASSPSLRSLAKGATSSHRGATLVASAGTGGAAAGTLADGTTGRTAGTAGAAGPADPGSGTAGATSPKPKGPRHDKHQTSNSNSGLPAAFTGTAHVITQVVKVIPTGVWIALAAAFGIALACAALALRSSRRARRREREFVAISAAAQTDPLTGILNRRGFMDAAERELARASRYDRPFVLAYVDVRGLKAVNDTEGHLVGDELIKAVAGLMKESARADDVVGRIGGDEFALLLGEQTADGAEPVVRRIRAHVEERRAAMEIRVPWELTIGIAAFPHDGTTLEELLGIADRRLYEQRGIALR